MDNLKQIKRSMGKKSVSLYKGLIHKEHEIQSFFTDEKARDAQIKLLKKDLRKNAKKINEEVQLERQSIQLLKKHAEGKKLTKKEKKIVKTSIIDICKVVPSLGIFLLPGGMVLLPLVSKILPFDLMPSAFQKRKKLKRKITKKTKKPKKTKRKTKRR